MSATIDGAVASTTGIALRLDLQEAEDRGVLLERNALLVRMFEGRNNVWLAMVLDGTTVAHVRIGPNAGRISNLQIWSKPDGSAGCEFTTPLGPVRAKIVVHENETLRCTTSLLAAQTTRINDWARDLYGVAVNGGTVHTQQRGLRSGIVYASSLDPAPFSVLYFQNFSSLAEYFTVTNSTPAGTVGGSWPELGYAPPAGDDCILPKAREITISDALISLRTGAPAAEGEIAGAYLDQLARVYTLIEKPETAYHDWTERSVRALRDLSLSPLCTYTRQGRRYVMPYVGDETKPPESMVQFALAVNTGEYDRWRNEQSALSTVLRETVASFYNEDIGAVVRWLPGESFEENQADDNMNHEAMDSWYLHHALFNVFRIASEGDARAKDVFRKSLPYLTRVARRFNYRWPIFFNLQSLDVIRAEAAPGAGGETDVAGLYALVMLHAYDMFGESEYLREAETALSQLHGLGFDLAYQLNTTGFAAEAALRLWKMTKKPEYLGLSTVCLANLFDNMWLWECDYENARHYRTFFGLFPLRDAPYLAPYEELEAHAKFHEYLELGGDDVRPSLKLLLAEFQKYALDRCWYYFPDTLPVDVVADTPRNGRNERGLSVPLEDLQDGREQSGSVGQEIYGAGLPFIMTSRHYMHLDGTGTIAYCDYPMFDFVASSAGGSWRAGGDPRGSCLVRVAPAGVNVAARAISAQVGIGSAALPVPGRLSPEGHAVFPMRGGQTIRISCTDASAETDACVVIGALTARGAR